jgi:hypothetical protein
MAEKRITYFGWTDYSIASLDLIIEDLREDYLPSIADTIKRLEELKGETVRNSDRIDDADSILNYIGIWTTIFQSFADDLKRTLNEMPRGVEKRHVDILKKIYERSVFEDKESNREFKREYIEKDMKDESLRPLIDEIYSVSGNQLVHNKNLGGMSQRLATYVGSRIPIAEKEPKAATIVPFHTSPGITWDGIEIRFLSNKAVELIAGNVREGRGYQEIGLLDGRGKGPNILWLVLASFAKQDGEIGWHTKGLHNRVHKNLKSHVNRLNKILMELLQIKNDKPFEYKWKSKSYRAKFRINIVDEDAYDDILEIFRKI